MTNIELLKKLQEQVNLAVTLADSGCLKTLEESELEKHVLSRTNHHDFVVGDFAVHVLTPFDRVWPKEKEPNAS